MALLAISNSYSLKMYDRLIKTAKDFNINIITSTKIDNTKIIIDRLVGERKTEQTNSNLSISKDPEVLDKIVVLKDRNIDTELSFTSEESVLQAFKRKLNDSNAEVVYGPSKVQVPGKLNIEIKYISINKENTNGDV